MKKCLTIILSIMMVFATILTSFAETTVNETNVKAIDERPEKREMPENMIFGKIKSINATTVTIEVATRKEMEKPESGKNNDDMRKPLEKQNDAQNQNQKDNSRPEKPNMDDMFTLTGETKTINIAQADFGNDFEKGSKPKGINQEENSDNKLENVKKRTYTDYSVGDYIMIETTDSTSSTAKSLKDAGRMGGGPDGPQGRDDFGDNKNHEDKNNQNNKLAPPKT